MNTKRYAVTVSYPRENWTRVETTFFDRAGREVTLRGHGFEEEDALAQLQDALRSYTGQGATLCVQG